MGQARGQPMNQPMTNEAKRALAKTIRGLRAQLIEDLGEATERAYRLSLDAKKAKLDEAARIKRARLEGWIDEQVRALPAKSRAGAALRLRQDVVKDAAATLLLRLVYLRLLEASGLSSPKIVTGGWDSRGYKDFREAAPELARSAPGARDDTEGYATLLGLVFDELALDLPGLYGPVRMTALVPVPAATLRAVIDALDDEELASAWRDDTTLGWIYQYWNDPEREALDAKLAAAKKLENHEIASKTQMFTERYMVEWLLHNSLGQMWLAMCRRHGWVARAEQPTAEGPSVLDQLEARREAWRAQREAGPQAGGVALDALMPISPGLEERWKYWVPQPMPSDAVEQAPESVRELKLLDPACGSGHFLVIAFELLFFLYQEEAWLRGAAPAPEYGAAEVEGEWSHRRIVESILEHNLHGLDIDPKAVQIAAAALMLKARQLCPAAEPRVMHLVAPALSLASLDESDPARRELYAAVQAETGLPPELMGRLVESLAGADHLGSLLRVDAELERALDAYEAQLSAAPAQAHQGSLFTGFAEPAAARRKPISTERARALVLRRLERFLEAHSRGADLGLRLRGEQLAAGVRFIRLVREGQYDLVIGNPPYLGTNKLADKTYIKNNYEQSKADLYAAFISRALELTVDFGFIAFVTLKSWIATKNFEHLRELSISRTRTAVFADLGWGAFDAMRDNPVVLFCLLVSRKKSVSPRGLAIAATAPGTRIRTDEHLKEIPSSVLTQDRRTSFEVSSGRVVPGSPIIFSWSTREFDAYRRHGTLNHFARVAQGISTTDDERFIRYPWEGNLNEILLVPAHLYPISDVERNERKFVPLIKGGKESRWIEAVSNTVLWASAALQIRLMQGVAFRNDSTHFLPGVAFTAMGDSFSARSHRYLSVCHNKGTSVFGPTDECVTLLNAETTKAIISVLNPGIGFEVGDVNRLPFAVRSDAREIMNRVRESFSQRECHRETSIEFNSPGEDCWRYAQAWAQLAVDRPEGAPLPPYEPVYDPEPPTDHLSFALGVALGRFGANGEGILTTPPATALPHGILFLSDASEEDSLAHPAAAPILAAWAKHGPAIDDKRSLKAYLQDRFFPDVHRKMYEKRPIYFPLSSARRAFVAYVSIHRWHEGTLNDLLAEHLAPAQRRLEGERADLRAARDGGDKKASRAAEKRLGEVTRWLEELAGFIALVEQCAEKGPPPPDGKTPPRAADARYAPDLDDGVMINSAALWPLLEPQWKDPKKWWKELATAEGKKDYDWAHLAARYFPARVDAKCQLDPSLAVAHGCFWRYHPAKAYQWELRLQDEIRADFTIDESGSDAARAAFLAGAPELAAELVAKEQLRRQRKAAKARGGAAESDDDDDDDVAGPQRSLELDDEAHLPDDEDQAPGAEADA